jgi:ribosomal protein S27AE
VGPAKRTNFRQSLYSWKKSDGNVADKVCPRCGAANPPDNQFCSKCGTALGTEAPVSQPSPASPSTAPSSYQAIMLPSWFTIGIVLVIIGGLLVMIGFMVDLVGTASLSSSSTLSSIQGYEETEDALIGVGFFIAVVGWVFHQMTIHRRRG